MFQRRHVQSNFFTSGIPTYTLINTTDLEYPGRVHKLDLLNLQGETLTEAPVVYDPQRPWLYNVSQFLAPDGWFYLKVSELQREILLKQRGSGLKARRKSLPGLKHNEMKVHLLVQESTRR